MKPSVARDFLYLKIWLCSSEVERLFEEQEVGIAKLPEATMYSCRLIGRTSGFDSDDVGSKPSESAIELIQGTYNE